MAKGVSGMMFKNLLTRSKAEDISIINGRRQKIPFAGDDCNGCGSCVGTCPTNAITIDGVWTMDAGKCISCMDCADVCERNAIEAIDGPDYVLDRNDLIFRRGGSKERSCERLDSEKLKAIGRSIHIREVDTGSCNSCEVEVNSLSNQYYDVERFGIKIVASPRHADVLLITGPVTENMHLALTKVVAATPNPKVIIAMGSCAISGGMFIEGNVIGEGVDDTVKVDVFIPGCPPSPDRLIRALLGAFGLSNGQR